MYALPLKIICKAKECSWCCGMWNGISFYLTHELLWQSSWHFSLLVPLEVHFKSCSLPSSNSGLLQIQVEGSMHELPSATRFSENLAMPNCFTCIFQYENFPPNPHITCDHIFKRTECNGCLAVVSLFMQLFLTLVSLSTMGNDRDGWDNCATGAHTQKK